MARFLFTIQPAPDGGEGKTARDARDVRAAVRASSNAVGAAFDARRRSEAQEKAAAQAAAAAAPPPPRIRREFPGPAGPCPPCTALRQWAPAEPWPPAGTSAPGPEDALAD